MVDSAQRERIRASGLFDAEYYRKIYGHLIADGRDPLEHFLEIGLRQGYLPSAGFDSVLYRVLVPGCGDSNPLLHNMVSGVPFQPASLTTVFPEAAAGILYKGNSNDPDIARHRTYAGEMAAARRIPFNAGDKSYALTIPEPGMLLDRLRMDRPFAFVRLPHGFWDALWMLDVAESEIASDARGRMLPDAERKALAIRLCSAVRSTHGAFVPLFMEETLADIRAHAGKPDFFRAVSFKGYPSFDEDIFGHRSMPPRDAVLRLFARHFQPEETLYDATQWKRLLISGHLRELPALCRGRPLVLVASRFFSRLGRRWRLDDFTQVLIPRRLSQRQRYELLARTSEAVAAACARSSRPPVILTQCGGSLAFWLFARLYEKTSRAFYIDLGQALDGWFFDVLEVHSSPWMRAYARVVIANCGLERFYQLRKGAHYDAWFNSLP